MSHLNVTFAEVLGHTRDAIRLANADAYPVKVSERAADEPPRLGQTDRMVVVYPGERWTWTDGLDMAGVSQLILTGEIGTQVWFRSDVDVPELSDSLLTDPVLGVNSILSQVITGLNDNPLRDGQGNSPLMEPLYVLDVTFPRRPDGTNWRVFTVRWFCKFRYRGTEPGTGV